ncbi:MAG: hypothetical protein HZA94_00745 [Candidatus Vogelbacteria bacterium]|nr:hypothetical protein [Candidatus Vogelbacteria bacterium]
MVKFIATIGLILPSLTFGATIESAVSGIITELSGIPVLLIGVAVIYFLFAVMQYTTGADEKTREEAQKKIVYGLIGIFVMVAMWGLVGEVQNIVGL